MEELSEKEKEIINTYRNIVEITGSQAWIICNPMTMWSEYFIPISIIEKKKNELKEVLDFAKTGKDEYSKGQASVLERTIKMIDKEILNERSNTDEK